MRFFYFSLYFLFSATFAFAQSPQTLLTFKAGNKAYAEKDYVAAIADYEKANKSGESATDLAYNLANAYAQNKELGKAILYYERALRLNPFDADAAQNLSIVKTWCKDDIEPIHIFFGIRWAKAIRNTLSSNTWTILGLCALFTMAVGAGFWLFGTTVEAKKRGFFTACTALCVAILPFWCAYETLALAQHSGFAIVQSSEIVMRTAPDAESSDIMTLHEGTRLEHLDQIGDWVKVELANGEQGWLPETAIAEI